MYGSACEWYEERRAKSDARRRGRRVVSQSVSLFFVTKRFLRSISPIETSKSPIRLRDQSSAPPPFPLGGRDLCFQVARDQHAPTPRAVAHNRGARESESYGDAGRSGSGAMTFVATALGPRVRPAAVAAGPRGSAHGGTVGAIATAANRQRCLRRRAPGATIARLDARHTLGVGAGAVRRARGDATSRGARACRLQVNAHGSHGTSLAPSETTSIRACPTRHRCLISRNPSVESASTWTFSLTNRHFSCAFPLARSRSFEAVPSPPRRPRVTAFDRSTHHRGPLP